MNKNQNLTIMTQNKSENTLSYITNKDYPARKFKGT